jgi:DNA-binding ferritin-like protein
MRKSIFPLIFVALLLHGCAAVQVQRAKDLSTAAVRFSDTTIVVIDAAVDAAINSDSQAQVLAMRPATTDEAQAQRKSRLETLNAALADTVVLYQSTKAQVNSVKAYFVALQDLANGSPAEQIEASVKTLSERVNGLSAALEGNASAAKPKLSTAKIDAIAGLSGKVVEQVHGLKVASALRRDATIIGKALALQERVLVNAGDDIRNELNQINNVFFVEKVERPYVMGTAGNNWPDDRRRYLKARGLNQTQVVVASAAVAAGQMQAVWERILAGSFSSAELIIMLKETEELLDAVAAFKAAK